MSEYRFVVVGGGRGGGFVVVVCCCCCVCLFVLLLFCFVCFVFSVLKIHDLATVPAYPFVSHYKYIVWVGTLYLSSYYS